jgi:tol-pal system protein YbgF
MRARALPALAAAVLASGCALRSDVVRLERQLVEQRREQARADSAAAANVAVLARMLQSLADTVAAQQLLLAGTRGDLRLGLANVQQQLVEVQELTGQSQQRLSELRRDLARGNAAEPARAAPPAAATPDTARAAPAAPAEPGADELYDLSLQQLRRGSPGTARAGFAEFLRRFPSDRRAPDALYFTGEAWTAEQQPDSAAAAYRAVVARFAQSSRAPSAHYRLGLQALAAGRTDEARTSFQRVAQGYPTSEEAALARERLRTLPPR